jgi:hypothetical protein
VKATSGELANETGLAPVAPTSGPSSGSATRSEYRTSGLSTATSTGPTGESMAPPPGSGEAAWRSGITALRTKLAQFEQLVADHSARLPKMADPTLIAGQLEMAKAELAKTKQDLEQYEESARRLGIPPGWLR